MKIHIRNSAIILLLAGMLIVPFLVPDELQKKRSTHARDDAVTSAFRLLTQNSEWKLVDVIKTNFTTYHTQGLVKIGDIFYISAVEIIKPTSTFGITDGLRDFSRTRTAGKGRAWLFKFNKEGELLNKIELTSGKLYHPGGIDYDGNSLWVPVSEYQPNSSTNIYRVDPKTMKAEVAFTVQDHIGGIVHNTARDTFHGVSWNSRRMYVWKIKFDDAGHGVISAVSWKPNPQRSISYQDCHYVGVQYMLCSGLGNSITLTGIDEFGGIDLIDISTDQSLIVHQIPVIEYIDDDNNATAETWSPEDRSFSVSHNSFWAEDARETDSKKLVKLYFMTEKDNQASLVIYELSFP